MKKERQGKGKVVSASEIAWKECRTDHTYNIFHGVINENDCVTE